MKIQILSILLIGTMIWGCNPNEGPDQALRQQTYLLHRASYEPISGTATVTEEGPGVIKVTIQLKNTSESLTHPAHLHFGSIAEVGELAFRLNDVDGKTGLSETIIDNQVLSNGLVLDYSLLEEMNGSIKVHMNDEFFKHVVLSYGNIGKNENYFFDGVAVCTGH